MGCSRSGREGSPTSLAAPLGSYRLWRSTLLCGAGRRQNLPKTNAPDRAPTEDKEQTC